MKSALKELLKSDASAQADLNEMIEIRLARVRADARRDGERRKVEHDEHIIQLRAAHRRELDHLRALLAAAEARAGGSLLHRLFPRGTGR